MSLDYDITKVPTSVKRLPVTEEMNVPGFMSYKKNGRTYMMSPLTHQLIFATMSTGIGEITEATYAEFWARLAWADRVDGHGDMKTNVWDKKEKAWVERDITVADVKNHIGLRTNVWPMEKRAAWIKRIGAMYFNDLLRKANQSEATEAVNV
jgi:hypothetical protein